MNFEARIKNNLWRRLKHEILESIAPVFAPVIDFFARRLSKYRGVLTFKEYCKMHYALVHAAWVHRLFKNNGSYEEHQRSEYFNYLRTQGVDKEHLDTIRHFEYRLGERYRDYDPKFDYNKAVSDLLLLKRC